MNHCQQITCFSGRDKSVTWDEHIHTTVYIYITDMNGKPLQYSCLENLMNSLKRQNNSTLKEELLRSVGVQHATGDQRRKNSRKNEGMEPKRNNTQLWIGLVIEARSTAVKSNIA